MATGEPTITGVVGEAAAPTTSDQPSAWQGPSFDTETRQRLEQIIESAAMDDYDKQRFYAQMGSTERVRQYEEREQRRVQEQWNGHIEEFLARLRKRMSKKERDTLAWELQKFHYDYVDREGITHPAMDDIFRGTYKLARETKDYYLALHVGEEHLHLPEEQLQEAREKAFQGQMGYSAHICDNGYVKDTMGQYIDTLKQWGEKISPARREQLARKVYQELLEGWSDDKERSENLFQAALLARECDFGSAKVLDPIRRYFSYQDQQTELWEKSVREEIPLPKGFDPEKYRPPSYNLLENLIDAFNLPPTMVHTQMRRLFSRELHHDDTALRLLARGILTKDEITGIVNEDYLQSLSCGHFESALHVRKNLGEYIQQEKVGLEDLRLLAKIAEGVRLNRQ